MAQGSSPPEGTGSVREVAAAFLRLSVIGFGGPAAHTAMMREELVRRRGWVDDRQFLELVGATNLVPGPNSTELAIQLGHERAGVRGLLTAGLCFIVPSVVIVAGLAWLYERYGTTPAVVDLRYGILPVIIAIVLHAVIGLGRAAIASLADAVLVAASFGAYLLGVHELVILAGAAVLALGWAGRRRLGGGTSLGLLLLPVRDVLRAVPREPPPVSLGRLFLVFLEIGSVLYGSGYVLLAFLQGRLVDDLGWLTNQQVLDAVAVGQITPGPVFTTATFVGWLIDGPAGALVATVGIFLPSFVFVALLGRLVPWIRRHAPARAALAGVVAASLGLMAGALVDLAGSALVDPFTVVLAAAALALLVRTRLNVTWVVGLGAAVGLAHLLW